MCFRAFPFVLTLAHVYMLSALSQCVRRGPVYLVFITKPFTEAPIRIKLLSAHTDHRTRPCESVCVKETQEQGAKGDYSRMCVVFIAYVRGSCCTRICAYVDHTSPMFMLMGLTVNLCTYAFACVSLICVATLERCSKYDTLKPD